MFTYRGFGITDIVRGEDVFQKVLQYTDELDLAEKAEAWAVSGTGSIFQTGLFSLERK